MKKSIVGLVAGALLSSTAAASPLVDQRGYKQCEINLDQQFQGAGLAFKREYFLKRTDEARTYYINGYVWDGEQREELQTTCVTTPNGREVLELESNIGEHIELERVAVR